MAKFFNKILDYIGLEEDVEEYDNLEQEELKVEEPRMARNVENDEFERPRSRRKDNKVISVYKNSNGSNNLIIYRPVSCEDSSHMIDSLKNKKPVIANFENIDHEKAQRILDMMSGAMYAISGSVHKVSKSIYVFAPDNMDVTGDGKDVAKVSSLFMDISK